MSVRWLFLFTFLEILGLNKKHNAWVQYISQTIAKSGTEGLAVFNLKQLAQPQ